MLNIVERDEKESNLTLLEKTKNLISSSLFEIDQINSDRVVMLNTSYEAPHFYENYFTYDKMSYPEWLELFIESSHEKDILPSTPVTITNVSSNMITNIRSFPTAYDQDPTIVIWVFIDETAINNLLEEMSTDGWTYIIDENGQVVASPREYNRLLKVETSPFQGKEGFIEQIFENEKVIISYTNCSYTGWRYVSVLPYRMVLEKTRFLRLLMAAVAVVVLLLGFITAYLLALRSSKPLKELVNVFKEKKISVDYHFTNEYLFIKRNVRELLEKNRSLQEQMKEQLPILRAAFFERLLKGEYITEDEIKAVLSQLGIEIKGVYFAIAVVRIKVFEDSVLNKRFNLLFKAKAVIKSMLGMKFQGRIQVHDRAEDEIVMLMTFTDSESGVYRSITEELLGEIYEELYNKHKIHLLFAAGNIYPDLIDVWHSYRESLEALNSMRISNDFSVMWYEEKTESRSGYYYPLSLEERLMNNTKAGNIGEVRNILKLIYKENIENRVLSPDMLRSFINDIHCSILKTLNQIDLNENESKKILMEKANNLSSYESFNDAYNIIEDIFISICSRIDNLKKSHKTDLIINIKEFIKDQHQDLLLNRYSVASHFRMTEEYLSSFFKEQTGVYFSDFLEAVRMNRASELLSEQDMPINNIAKAVGYSSVKAFSRAFKRVNGVSPSDYRKYIVQK
jgi:AraC-like DNA-binding protein